MNITVMGKTVAALEILSRRELCHFLEMPAQIESFATVMQSSCSSLCKKCSTSAAHFFAAAAGEPLLVLVSLSLSEVSLRLSELLASLFAATSNLGSRSSHLRLLS